MSGPLIPAPSTPERDGRETNLARIYALLRLVTFATVLILAIWLISDVLVVVFAAALLATILHGTAALLRRFTNMPHWAALTVVVVALVALLVGLGFSAGPGLSEQIKSLRQALTSQGVSIRERLSNSEWGSLVLDQLPKTLGGNKDGFGGSVPSGLAGSVAGVLGSAFGVLGTITVVIIAALYFAAAPTTYVNGALRLVPVHRRAEAKTYCEAAGKALWAWSAGQAFDMLVVGLLSGLGLWLIGVPLPLALGVVAGLFNFVPYIGAIAGAVPAVIIAFSVSPAAGLQTIALYVVIQGFEGNVMAPMIQKRAVDMPPGLTILSQAAFGAILGIPGLIFATPLTAMILAVMQIATPPLTRNEKVEIVE